MSTVEVTRRMSEERDLHPMVTSVSPPEIEDKERRLQRWREKKLLVPRDDGEPTLISVTTRLDKPETQSVV